MELSQKMKKGLICLLITAIVFTMSFTATADVLDEVPAGSIFCVTINNFDGALGQLDQFLSGISPMPLAMMARGQVAQIIGDPSLQAVNTAGSFAIFGTPIPNEATGNNDIVIAALMPVNDYEQFVTLSAHVGQPDANGVSQIVAPAGMPGPPPMIAIKKGQFALVGPEANKANILKVAKSNAGSIAKSLDADQAKLSSEMPMWAYGDLEQINKSFGPMIQQFIASMEQEMKKGIEASPGPKMADPEQIVKIYKEIIQQFLNEGKYASIALKPEPDVLRIKKTLSAKPGTEMAKLLAADPTLPKENKLAGYLQDGAAMNFAMKSHSNWQEAMAEMGLSFMKNLGSDENAEKWASIISESAQANGNLMAFSMKANSQSKPPFIVRGAQTIKDKEKHQLIMDKSVELMNSGMMSDIAQQGGIKMDFDIQKAASTYKDITIDSAKLTFEVIDTNSPEAQMIAAMYGEGFDYRFAYVDDVLLTAVGAEPDAVIKELIDKAKADSQTIPSEMTAAMQLLPSASNADCVGSLNIIRFMEMATGFMPMPMPLPFDQIQTSSNIAFAVVVVDVALPKQHLTELMTGMMMMQQQMGGQPGMAPPIQ